MDPYQVWISHIKDQGNVNGMAKDSLLTNYQYLRDAEFTYVAIPPFLPPSIYSKFSTSAGSQIVVNYALSGGKRYSINAGGWQGIDENRPWPRLPNLQDDGESWLLHEMNNPDYQYLPDGEHSSIEVEQLDFDVLQPYLLARVNEHETSTDSTPFVQYLLLGSQNKFASESFYYAGLRFAHSIEEDYEDGDKILFSVRLGHLNKDGVVRLNDDILIPNNPLEVLDSEYGGSNFHYSSYISNLAMPNPPDVIQDEELIKWSLPIEVTFDDVYNGTYRVDNEVVHIASKLVEHYIGPFGIGEENELFPKGFLLPMAIRIDWHGEADFFLQWIEIFNHYHYDLVILNSEDAKNEIATALINSYNDHPFKSKIAWWGFDEPSYYYGRSFAIVDSIARATTGKGLNGPLSGDIGQFENDYIGWLWNTKKVFVGDRIPGYPDNMASYSHKIKNVMINDIYVLHPNFTDTFTTNTSTSIQSAYDKLIRNNGNNGTGRNQGLWGANLISRLANIPWNHVVGVQSEWLKNDETDVYDFHNFRDPTPEEVKVQAYLALSFGAKGLGFYNVTSIYDWARGNDNRNAANAPPFLSSTDSSRAQVRGLFDFVDANGNYFSSAQNLLNGLLNQNGGYFKPNPKYFAVKEVGQHLSQIGPALICSKWDSSACTAIDVLTRTEHAMYANPVYWTIGGFVRVDSVWYVNSEVSKTIKGDSSFIQLATFRDTFNSNIRHVLITNRYTRSDEYLASVMMTVDITPDNWVLREENQSIKYFNHTSQFYVELGPGEAKLVTFYIDDGNLRAINMGNNWSGTVIVDTTVKVGNLNVLNIAPGTEVLFTEDGLLEIEGRLLAKGKEDSMIVFRPMYGNHTGEILLTGNQADTLYHCEFNSMSYGLTSAKSTTSVLRIKESAFINNEAYGLKSENCEVQISHSILNYNGTDGAYLYNCLVEMDSCEIIENGKTGLFLYGVNSSSFVKGTKLEMNGTQFDGQSGSNVYANFRIYNSSPILEQNHIRDAHGYGIYGVNGSYPVMFTTGNAANTITNNASHETYWNASYPSLSYGHNNFSTEDDTIIYITNVSLSSFYAEGNYWGGTGPNLGTPSSSYYGPGVFYYSPADLMQQVRINARGIHDVMLPSDKHGKGAIASAEEDAMLDYREAVLAERTDCNKERGTIYSEFLAKENGFAALK